MVETDKPTSKSHKERLIDVLETALRAARDDEVRSLILVGERSDNQLMIGRVVADGDPHRILTSLHLVATDLELRTLDRMFGSGMWS